MTVWLPGRVADLRIEAVLDTTEVREFLEGMKDQDIDEIAFSAKAAILDLEIKVEDWEAAKQELAKLRTEYAGIDSVGGHDVNRPFRYKERLIKINEELKKLGGRPHRIE